MGRGYGNGTAADLGGAGPRHPWPIIGIAGHPSKSGFWLVTRQVPINRRPIGAYFLATLADGLTLASAAAAGDRSPCS